MRVITLGSGSAAVGRTFLAANLGVALARRGARTCVVDLDLTCADLHLLLGLFKPRASLLDALRDGVEAHELMEPVPGEQNLHLIPGSSETVSALGPNEVGSLLAKLRQLPVDFVIIDLNAGFAAHQLDIFLGGDEQWLVTSSDERQFASAARFLRRSRLRRVARHGAVDESLESQARSRVYSSLDDLVRDLTELSDARKSGRPVQRLTSRRCGVVVNRALKTHLTAPELCESLGRQEEADAFLDAIATIPEEAEVSKAFSALTTLVKAAPSCGAMQIIDDIARRLLPPEAPAEGSGLATREPALV